MATSNWRASDQTRSSTTIRAEDKLETKKLSISADVLDNILAGVDKQYWLSRDLRKQVFDAAMSLDGPPRKRRRIDDKPLEEAEDDSEEEEDDYDDEEEHDDLELQETDDEDDQKLDTRRKKASSGGEKTSYSEKQESLTKEVLEIWNEDLQQDNAKLKKDVESLKAKNDLLVDEINKLRSNQKEGSQVKKTFAAREFIAFTQNKLRLGELSVASKDALDCIRYVSKLGNNGGEDDAYENVLQTQQEVNDALENANRKVDSTPFPAYVKEDVKKAYSEMARHRDVTNATKRHDAELCSGLLFDFLDDNRTPIKRENDKLKDENQRLKEELCRHGIPFPDISDNTNDSPYGYARNLTSNRRGTTEKERTFLNQAHGLRSGAGRRSFDSFDSIDSYGGRSSLLNDPNDSDHLRGNGQYGNRFSSRQYSPMCRPGRYGKNSYAERSDSFGYRDYRGSLASGVNREDPDIAQKSYPHPEYRRDSFDSGRSYDSRY